MKEARTAFLSKTDSQYPPVGDVRVIAILPAIVFTMNLTHAQAFSIFFGGTSLLIMVGVILDTLQQIESYLLSRQYDSLMESGKLRGRQGTSVSGMAG